MSKPRTQVVDVPAAAQWHGLYRTAALSAIVMLVLIPVQAAIYLVWPPPLTAAAFFTLLQENWLLGLISLDLFFLLDVLFIIPIYLALYLALKQAQPSAMLLALVLGLVGIAAYFSSNVSFEMLALSNRYAAAADPAQQSLFLAAGEAMLATYIGTAFNVYYELSTLALLVMSVVMLRSPVFSKLTAYMGIAAAILMIIPSTAGMLGLVLSLLSLIPWVVWLILFARRAWQLAGAAPGRVGGVTPRQSGRAAATS